MKKSGLICRRIAAVTAASLMITAVSVISDGSIGAEVYAENVAYQTTENNSEGYSAYLTQLDGTAYATETVSLSGGDFSGEQGSGAKVQDYAGASNVLYWESGKGTVTYQVDVPVSAFYNISLSYRPLEDNLSAVEFGIMVDGAYPYSDLEGVSFPAVWANETEEFASDKRGNQLTPAQVMKDGMFHKAAMDNTGVQTEPYLIGLSAGRHTVTLVGCGNAAAIASVNLIPPEDEPTYKELSKTYENSGSNKDAEPIVLQGENATDKTSRSLTPRSDTISANVTPANSKNKLLNHIGGSSWEYVGDSISWNFNVTKAGYYKLGFKYKQSVSINRSSYRWLTVDGKTPFEEAREIDFEYSNSWQLKEFAGKDGDPYLIWLDEGDHTITMEAVLGETAAGYYRDLQAISDELNDIYLDIVKITSTSPDISRDYELFRQIPDLNDRLTENRDALNKLIDTMLEAEGGSTSEIVGAMRNMVRVMKNMLNNPYLAQQYITNFFSCFSTLTSCVYDMAKMPLAIDELYVVAEANDFPSDKVSFFKTLGFRIGGFLYSFSDEYKATTKDETEDSITVWVAFGRDQASVLEAMIREGFTAETGINVNLKVVTSSLVHGIVSGKYPDVRLSDSRSEPVNLGMRGALCDLTQFEDFEEVLTRFQDGAEEPYCFRDACYGLPDTQSYFVMFYRTDILKKLGVEVPNTWDEFKRAMATIQRSNMDVYIPYTQITAETTVNAGIGSLHLFPTLMLQSGLSLYNDTKTESTLSDAATIEVFDTWTKFYNDYKVVKQADFYNRFRTGTMPMGIAGYTTYFNFTEMAPEIQGKWAIDTVPGNEDGSNSVSGGGSASVILEKSEKKEESWEFLKWWTSADVQAEYSRRVESILGLIGRVATSNVDAFKQLEWENDAREVLLEQWSRVVEIPEVPGSYYLSRSVDQAYWQVINGESNSVDALTHWAKSTNDEIERKYQEYCVEE